MSVEDFHHSVVFVDKITVRVVTGGSGKACGNKAYSAVILIYETAVKIRPQVHEAQFPAGCHIEHIARGRIRELMVVAVKGDIFVYADGVTIIINVLHQLDGISVLCCGKSLCQIVILCVSNHSNGVRVALRTQEDN